MYDLIRIFCNEVIQSIVLKIDELNIKNKSLGKKRQPDKIKSAQDTFTFPLSVAQIIQSGGTHL